MIRKSEMKKMRLPCRMCQKQRRYRKKRREAKDHKLTLVLFRVLANMTVYPVPGVIVAWSLVTRRLQIVFSTMAMRSLEPERTAGSLFLILMMMISPCVGDYSNTRRGQRTYETVNWLAGAPSLQDHARTFSPPLTAKEDAALVPLYTMHSL